MVDYKSPCALSRIMYNPSVAHSSLIIFFLPYTANPKGLFVLRKNPINEKTFRVSFAQEMYGREIIFSFRFVARLLPQGK
jgi:hypothetical protein